MVRLVFRPYTHIWRTICTSVSLRASTRVSTGFTLYRHSSPSFGYQQICSHSNQSPRVMIGWWCTFMQGSHHSRPSLPLLSFRLQVFHPTTRIHVRLLGPCFKTGLRSTFPLWIRGSIQQQTHGSSTVTHMELPKKCHTCLTHELCPSLRLSRDPTFLRQTDVFNIARCHPPEWRLPKLATFSRPSNASRGPEQHSAPIHTNRK